MKKWFFILLMMVGMAVPGFSKATEHVVKVGETFASIAQKYGMTEQQLKEANPKYKNYEGDTDKEGRPDGYGTMYFEAVYGDEAFTEKLEGTWKKGAPVKGKSFRYYKDNGKLRMKFEGKFNLKEKGVLRNLWDLKALGNIVFYYYENDKFFEDRGYYVMYGSYNGKDITKGYCVSSKKKAMAPVQNWEIGYWSTNLNPEARKYLDELIPSVGSAWIFDRKPEFKRIHVVRKKDSFIKLNNIYWSGSIKNGLLDGKGSGSVSTTLDKNNTVQYSIEGEFREGAPLNVRIYRILLHKALVNNMWTHNKWVTENVDESTVEVTTGELRNNLRPFRVDRIRGRSYWREDTSYEGYVDENFKFKSDYAEEAKKEQIEKENQAWEGLYKTWGSALRTVKSIEKEFEPEKPDRTYGSDIIDWDQSKSPSGELKSSFDGFEYSHIVSGVICFKNNLRMPLEYNILYDRNKEFKYYIVYNYSTIKAKNYNDMIATIIEYINTGRISVDSK